MANKTGTRRHIYLFKLFTSGKYISTRELLERLRDQDFIVSERTLSRDIQYLRDSFQMDIVYEPLKNAYIANTDNSFATLPIHQFIDMVSTADTLTQSFSKNRGLFNHIHFEKKNLFTGLNNLETVISAMLIKRPLRFEHYNFYTEETTTHLVHPYFIKEFQGRWYVIAFSEGKEAIRTFGLDRIQHLEIVDGKLREDRRISKYEFDDVIGVTLHDGPVEEVVLQFTSFQGKYVKSLPFHHTQKILVDNEEECKISIRVKPNTELVQKILMMRSEVRVLAPQSLVDEVAEEIKRMAKLYTGA